MRKVMLFAALAVLVPFAAFAVQRPPKSGAQDKPKEKAPEVEVTVYQGDPPCKNFQVVTMVNGKGRSADKAYQDMLKSARKMGAEAVCCLNAGQRTIGVPTTVGYGSLMVSQPTVTGTVFKCLPDEPAKKPGKSK